MDAYGDEAGVKAIKDLSGFFGTKDGFHADKDYVLIPRGMAIESIFLDDWVKEAHNSFSAWFETWIPDANGSINYFSIRDKSKKAYMEFIFQKIDNETSFDWLTSIKKILNSIEIALEVQIKQLSRQTII